MKSQKKLQLLTGNVNSLFFKYLGPSMAATIMISINFFVDTLCIGQKLGERGLAALSIAQPVLGCLYAFGYLFGIGGSTLYSASMGRGDKKQAQQYYGIASVSILAVSAAVMVCGLIFLKPITVFLGGGPTLQDTMDYLLYVFMFAPVYCIEPFLTIFTRNDKAPRLSMMATLLSCSINIVLDIYFIFVLEWGMAGAALATSLAISSCVILLGIGTVARKGSGLKIKRFRFEWKKFFQVFRSGTPSYVLEMTGAVVTLTFNTVLLRISGVTAVGVYGIIVNLTIMATSAISGVSNAMQPLVSANAGAGKQQRVRQILKIAVGTAFMVSALCVLVGTLQTEAIIRFFITPNAEFLAIAVPGVRIVCISYLIVSANALFTVYFQSIQADNAALALSVLHGVIMPVICVIGCAFYFGIMGVWFSSSLSELLSLFVGLVLLRGVQANLREKNYYDHLNFFSIKRPEENIERIFSHLGADDLTTFVDLIHYCNSRDEENEGIPAFIGLDDLTSDYEGDYQCAEQDEDMGLLLAVGGLLLADMYEQNEAYMRDKQLDLNWPAAAPAMSALAEKCFRFEYDETDDRTDIIPYSEAVGKFQKKPVGGKYEKF